MNEEKKLELFKEAAQFLEDHGYEAEVREDYSGRGMYGRTTPAIVTDAPGTLLGYAFGIVMNEDEDHLDPADFIPRSSDSMGLRTVWY